MKYRLLIIIMFALATATLGARADYAETEVTEELVSAQAELLLREVERIRLYMGVRPPRSRLFTMEGAQPRHVFFQSQIVFRRCNLLARQLTGISRVAAPTAPEGDPSFAEVLAVIDAARAQLDVVEAALETTRPLPDVPKTRARGMSAAMVRMVEAYLLLNQVTDFRADWSDIWDNLHLMITYLGGALPEEGRYPSLEEHVPGKTIADVAEHLLSVRGDVAPASEAVGVAEVRTTIIKPAEGGPSTEGIFDLTTSLINEIAEITHRLDAEDVDPPDYERPARVFPSHAFQLATVLRKQAEAVGQMYAGKR